MFTGTVLKVLKMIKWLGKKKAPAIRPNSWLKIDYSSKGKSCEYMELLYHGKVVCCHHFKVRTEFHWGGCCRCFTIYRIGSQHCCQLDSFPGVAGVRQCYAQLVRQYGRLSSALVWGKFSILKCQSICRSSLNQFSCILVALLRRHSGGEQLQMYQTRSKQGVWDMISMGGKG